MLQICLYVFVHAAVHVHFDGDFYTNFNTYRYGDLDAYILFD